jgi:hypothetical protein
MPREFSHFKAFYSFPHFFSAMCAAIAMNFVHGFISMTFISSSKMVAIDQFWKSYMYAFELSHLRDFYSFPDFLCNLCSFVHGFISMTYISSLKMVSINHFYTHYGTVISVCLSVYPSVRPFGIFYL